MPESDEPGPARPARSHAGSGGAGALHFGQPASSTGSGDRGTERQREAASAQLAAEVAERVVEAVAWARAKATLKLVIALRTVVYGLVALVGFITAVLLATVGLVRVWDAYVPVYPLSTRVWLGYVIFGVVFFAPGLWLVGRRASRQA